MEMKDMQDEFCGLLGWGTFVQGDKVSSFGKAVNDS